MTDPKKSCRNCKHVSFADQRTTLHCNWERNVMPPAVIRARLWGEPPARIFSEQQATECPQYEEPPND